MAALSLRQLYFSVYGRRQICDFNQHFLTITCLPNHSPSNPCSNHDVKEALDISGSDLCFQTNIAIHAATGLFQVHIFHLFTINYARLPVLTVAYCLQ